MDNLATMNSGNLHLWDGEGEEVADAFDLKYEDWEQQDWMTGPGRTCSSLDPAGGYVRANDYQLRRRDFLKLAPLCAASWGLLAHGQPAPSSSGIPLLGDFPQLFVDLERVELLENVQQVFHSSDKHPSSPVIRRIEPWETDRGTWGSVSFDAEERIFKAWYGGFSGREYEFLPGTKLPCSVLCYAISQDGVRWERPKLGLHEVMGTRENNVVVSDDHHQGMAHWESVLKDPLETIQARRYKGLGWSSFDWNGPLSGIYTMTSPDGLHWTHSPEPIVHFHPRQGTNDLGPIGDAQALMIDTLRRRYVALLRALPDRKMSVSADFINWSGPRVCLKARGGEESNAIYNHVGFVYGDRYLGFLTYFSRDPANPLLTLRLVSSRDGDNWERPETGPPLIDVGEIGEWDRFTIMLTGAPPIKVGDKLHIYYRGLANRHKPYEGKDTGLAGGGIGLATLRADGFASLNANYEGGRVTTRLFTTESKELHINAKADVGQIKAEVLDEQRLPIPGFTHDDSQPMHANSCDFVMRWTENVSLSTLRGRPIRLRFYLKNARFYSYRLAKADIDHLISTAKTSWTGGNPARPVAGMTISVQPSSGTARMLKACFPNSKVPEPESAGNGALNGKILSFEWNAAAKTGRLVVRPQDPAAAPVTINTDKGTQVQVLRMWSALAPYDTEIQKNFEAVEEPDGWGDCQARRTISCSNRHW